MCSGLREPCAGLGASAAVRFASWHFASSQVQGSGNKALGAMAMSYCVASLTTAINYIQAVWTAPVSSAPLRALRRVLSIVSSRRASPRCLAPVCWCFAAGRCHPAAGPCSGISSGTGPGCFLLGRPSLPCHLLQFLQDEGMLFRWEGTPQLAPKGRCNSVYACRFTSWGAFNRISVLGPLGCFTALAAAPCLGRQHPAGARASMAFTTSCSTFYSCASFQPVGQYRRRCAVALLPPLGRAVLLPRQHKKIEKSCMAVPLTARGCSASPVGVGCLFPVG